MVMRYLHLSDFHLTGQPKDEGSWAVEQFNQDVVTSSMIESIKQLVQNQGKNFDLIFITGDLAYSGKEEEYQVVEVFIRKLLEVTGVPAERLFLVPGNNDVNRGVIGKLYFKLLYNFQKSDEVTEIVGDKDAFPMLMRKFTAFNSFANRAMSRQRFSEHDYFYSEAVSIHQAGGAGLINVVGLNSALFAGYEGDDVQKLAFGLPQVDKALGQLDEGAQLTIILFHHPFTCFHPADRVCQNRLMQKADLILTGHLHEPENFFIRSAAGQSIRIGAGASFETRESENSFNVGEIDLENGSGRVQFYKYLANFHRWKKNTDANPDNEEGIFSFEIERLRKAVTPGTGNSLTDLKVAPLADLKILSEVDLKTTPKKRSGRCLRIFAFNPIIPLQDSVTNEATLEFPWEDINQVMPGPVDEYLEVIDHDPASGCFYVPVDLNEPRLLAQDGLPPSLGDPKFHQQMVYAVARTTINCFEQALGRKVLWAPHRRDRSDTYYVQRLRIYPHALREANSYYSPDKNALLFGYCPPSETGEMIFTCLSHDNVVHETTHALLDGLHPNFLQPENNDQLAFHEAFADIVALLQHFSMPEVLRQQIGRTRGDLRMRHLLGELAQQFGLANGMRGSLRSVIGKIDPETGQWVPMEPDPTWYQTKTNLYARGSLLVAAVFDAFLFVYEARIGDLIRLATLGPGITPSGALHPDLVDRFSEAAAKAAGDVLTVCIRALDYCPPVDLTFGDYLRALITADYDILSDDSMGYQAAFLKAFRRYSIYPRDFRSLSLDVLRWRPAFEDQSEDLLRPVFSKLRDFADRFLRLNSRQEMFQHNREWRMRVHTDLKEFFQGLGVHDRQSVMSALGLDLTTGKESFQVHALRVACPYTAPLQAQILLTLVQERRVPRDPDGGGPPSFRGGCTIIADKRTAQVKYYISKNILNADRLARQQSFNNRLPRTLADVYFGAGPLAGLGERFAMLHADKEVY